MKYYMIITLSISGTGRNILRNNEVHPQTSFREDDIEDLLETKAIREATDAEVKEAGLGKEEVDPEKELQEAREEYSKIEGAKDPIPKTWGVNKLRQEIEKANSNAESVKVLTDEYLSLEGSLESVPEDWDAERLKAEIAELKKA